MKGRVFGDLTVKVKVPTPKTQKQRWNCQCSCGRWVTVRHDYLLHTNSPKTHCGCKDKQPGLPTLEKDTYSCWQAMMMRCYHERHVSYADYGGRGIRVHEAWHRFETFLAEVGRRPSKRYSLDRRDANGSYEPGNVRWATKEEQARNKRGSVRLAHPTSGVILPAADIAESLGLTYHQFRKLMIDQGKWPTREKPAGTSEEVSG